jgi:hypothetical protein
LKLRLTLKQSVSDRPMKLSNSVWQQNKPKNRSACDWKLRLWLKSRDWRLRQRLIDSKRKRRLTRERRPKSMHLLRSIVSNRSMQLKSRGKSMRKLKRSALLRKLRKRHTGKKSVLNRRQMLELQQWQKSQILATNRRQWPRSKMNMSFAKRRKRSLLRLPLR